MFASVHGSSKALKDTVFPSFLGQKEKIVGNIGFPLDCVGVIISFFPSTGYSDVLKCLIASSETLERYIKMKNPNCCRHILWKYSQDPGSHLRYVHSLLVSGVSGNRMGKNGKVMLNFPSLEKLVIMDTKLGFSFFKHVNPKLLKLEIDCCPKLTKNAKSLSNLKVLRELRIDYSHHKPRNRKLNFSFLQDLPTLRKLFLTSMTPVNFHQNHFRSLERLRVLELRRVEKIDGTIFQYTRNLERLSLFKCASFSSVGFEYLRRLRSLEVDCCLDVIENRLKTALGDRFKKLKSYSFLKSRKMKKGEVVANY